MTGLGFVPPSVVAVSDALAHLFAVVELGCAPQPTSGGFAALLVALLRDVADLDLGLSVEALEARLLALGVVDADGADLGVDLDVAAAALLGSVA